MDPKNQSTEFTEIRLNDPVKSRSSSCSPQCFTHWLTSIRAFLSCMFC